ncbi:MAG: hotdog fold thioesterase [Alphaproteobacteria bacterium]|nr:hotdog fold thioesterase [Alphaproteobacteria bacterium]
MSRITKAEIAEIVAEALPFAASLNPKIVRLKAGDVSVRMPFRRDFIRPGGTIAGPLMMGLADFTMYVVVMSLIGRVELAVTTNLNINFLRKPEPRDMLAHGTMLKLGKRLAVMEVGLYSVGDREPVAHVTGTYSIPPRDGEKRR